MCKLRFFAVKHSFNKLGFFRTLSEFVPALISQYQWGCPYTHVGLLYGKDAYIEAKGKGVVAGSGSPPYVEWDEFFVDCTVRQKAIAEDFIIKQLGKPYDYTGLLNFLSKGKNEEKEKWFCSELIAAGMEAAEIWPYNWEIIRPFMVSPRLLVAIGKKA